MGGLNQSELHHVTKLSVSHYTFEFYTAMDERRHTLDKSNVFPPVLFSINILVYILTSV